jgi:hypothetical protein
MVDREHRPAGEAGPDAPADDGFEVEDERLNKALKRYDRTRAGSPGAEFGHDQTYRPGYHQGGVRFGFFHDADEKTAPADAPKDKPPGKS